MKKNRYLHAIKLCGGILAGVIIFLIVLEVSLRLAEEAPPQSSRQNKIEMIGPWKNQKSTVPLKEGRNILVAEGKVIFDIPFTIDEGSRRKSTAPTGKPEKFLVFIGCSFTFGTGVHDTETFPSQVQKLTNEFRVYNYGVGGFAPLDMLDRLQQIELSDLQERSGRVIYSYINSHLVRMAWRPKVIPWASPKAYLQMDKEGRITSPGSYAQVYPLRTFFYTQLSKSYTYQAISGRIPYSYSQEEIREFARILTFMNKESLRLSGNPLIVMIWPDQTIDPSLILAMSKTGVQLLDYSSLDVEKLTNGNEYIPIDGHPTADAYEVVAKHLIKEI